MKKYFLFFLAMLSFNIVSHAYAGDKTLVEMTSSPISSASQILYPASKTMPQKLLVLASDDNPNDGIFFKTREECEAACNKKYQCLQTSIQWMCSGIPKQ